MTFLSLSSLCTDVLLLGPVCGLVLNDILYSTE